MSTDQGNDAAPWLASQLGGRMRLAVWCDPAGVTLLATGGSDGGIQLWDAGTGAASPVQVPGHAAAVFDLAFAEGSHGLRLLSAGTESDIRVWDPVAGTLVDTIAARQSGTRALTCWSGDYGQRVSIGGYDGTVQIVDLDTGKPVIGPLTGHAAPISTLVAWQTTDGRVRLASASDDGAIRVWNAETGELVAGPFGPATGVTVRALATWSDRDGAVLLAAGTGDGAVEVWQAETGTLVERRLRHGAIVMTLATGLDPTGKTMLCSGDAKGTVWVCDADTGAPASSAPSFSAGASLSGHSVVCWRDRDGVAWLATATGDGVVRIWDLCKGELVRDFTTRHVAAVWALASWRTADGASRLASVGSHGVIQIWDADTGALLTATARHEPGVWALASWTDADARTTLFSGGVDGTILQWNPDDGTTTGPALVGHPASISALVCWNTPTGALRLASVGDDSTVRIWDPLTGSQVGGPLAERRGGLVGLAWWRTSGGQVRIASAGADRVIRVWDSDSGVLVDEITSGGCEGIWSLCSWTGPDGSPRIASGDADGTVRIWTPEPARLLHTFSSERPGRAPILAAWQRPGGDAELAAAGADGVIHVWNPDNGQRIATLTGHTGGVRALVFLPRPGRSVWLASAADDGTVRLWDPDRGVALRTVEVGAVGIWGLSDAPATADAIGRHAMVDEIVAQLRPATSGASDSSRPVVVTIEGPWGSGKTTLMELIRRQLATLGPATGTPPAGRRHRLRVRDALRQLYRYPPLAAPAPPPAADSRIASAWFNPWAHQSGEQIWAGLAESIIEAAAPVLYPTEEDRERYWFRRNLARLDRSATRASLQKRILSPLLGVALLTTAVPIALALTRLDAPLNLPGFKVRPAAIALLLPLMFLLAGLLHTAVRYRFGRAITYVPSEIFNRPVAPQGDAVDVGVDSGKTSKYVDPLLQATRGSLYLYQHDVNALLADIAAAGYELVVFIDDLDRCRATTTAEVIEAINLFLSGLSSDTLHARFVIGMDPTVIAAHLDQVYAGLADSTTAIRGEDPSPGWEFLRKLVQLPIAVPRIHDHAIDNFVRAATGQAAARPEPVSLRNPLGTSIGPVHAAGEDSPVSLPPQRQPGAAQPAPPLALPPVEVIAWRSLEQHSAIQQLLRERIAALPGRSIRDAKKIINVWQYYQRVAARLAPPLDTATAVDQACDLILLAEIITRWPALQRPLRQYWNGQSGLRLFAEAAFDDDRWRQATRELSLDAQPHQMALTNLRRLLQTNDGARIADLADLLT